MKKILSVLLSVIILLMFQLEIFALNNANGEEYYFKRNENNQIALTFDDGPHPKYTYEILDVLERYNIKATFFVIGVNAQNYKDALRAISSRGHEIGNHTFSHKCIKDKSAQEISDDIRRCKNIIYSICEKNTVVFRPPGGLMPQLSVSDEDLFRGYNIIHWSIDTEDWAHRSPEKIAGYVLENIKCGDIILMHDYIGKNSPTPQALELMIPELLERGFEFVTVSELIKN